MRRIAIFQSDFHVGGIQKSLVNLLKNMSKEDIEIDVFLFDDKDIFYSLEFGKNINLYFLPKLPYWNRFVYFGIAKRFWGRRILRDITTAKSKDDVSNHTSAKRIEYDVAIDFNSYWNECAIGTLCVPAKKRICWIHNDVIIKSQNEYKYRIIHHFFKGKYRWYDEFVPVSSGIQPSFETLNQIPDHGQYHVIPNYIDTDEIREKLGQPIPREIQDILAIDRKKCNIISLGRLCHQKGYDLMLRIILQVLQREKDVHFFVAGEGPDHYELMQQAEIMRVDTNVTFLGNLKNPYPVMNQMDAFLMMSRYEGQPLAFWEAKAVGLPVIIPEHLEKYTEGIPGSKDVVEAICKRIQEVKAQESPQELQNNNGNSCSNNKNKFNELTDYNTHIRDSLMNLMEQ